MTNFTNLRMLSCRCAGSSRTARTMVAKLSSSSTMCAVSFGDVGAGDAHGHADVGALAGRRVVHAIAGLAPRTRPGPGQRLHQFDFLRRRHARVDAMRSTQPRTRPASGAPARPVMTSSPGAAMPRCSATARAVAGWWSPVIITGVMPASRHSCTAWAASARGGSINPTSPMKVRSRLRFPHQLRRQLFQTGGRRARARAGCRQPYARPFPAPL